MKPSLLPTSLLGTLLLGITPAHAILDTNANGLSDLWEKYYNSGQLFPSATGDFAPTADPDHDGWTHLDEALAGTDPWSPQHPLGIVRATLTTHPSLPGNFFIDWNALPGKNYQLSLSTDLQNWASFGDLIQGDAPGLPLGIQIAYQDGSLPDHIFWRVHVLDSDLDGDQLTHWEEALLGTDPNLVDTDLDGLSDLWEATNHLDPLDPTGDNGPDGDPDGDSIPNQNDTHPADPNPFRCVVQSSLQIFVHEQGFSDLYTIEDTQTLSLDGTFVQNRDPYSSNIYPIAFLDHDPVLGGMMQTVTLQIVSSTPVASNRFFTLVQIREDASLLGSPQWLGHPAFTPVLTQALEFTLLKGQTQSNTLTIHYDVDQLSESLDPTGTLNDYLLFPQLAEARTEFGFDDYPREIEKDQHPRPWLMVPGDHSSAHTCLLSGLGNIAFHLQTQNDPLAPQPDPTQPSTPAQIQVDPERAIPGEPLTLSFQGTGSDDSTYLDFADGARILDIVTYPKKVVKLTTHAISITNDDVDPQTIKVGEGLPYTVCVRKKNQSGALWSTPGGDDIVVSGAINTGPNGICETQTDPRDEIIIETGYGQPDAPFLQPGPNGAINTIPDPFDDNIGTAITTGADGIRNTGAPPPVVHPMNVPSASELETRLNEIYGDQANIYFEVNSQSAEVAFDVGDPEGEFEGSEIKVNGMFDYLITKSRNTEEKLLIATSFQPTSYFNVYYLPCPIQSHSINENGWKTSRPLGYARSDFRTPYLRANGIDTTGLIFAVAHELGHNGFQGDSSGLLHPRWQGSFTPTTLGFPLAALEDDKKRLMYPTIEDITPDGNITYRINPNTGKPWALLLKEETDIFHGRRMGY
ncbi:hypothetical protein HNR46_001196 [Haloferula luteola]|uniref:Uncharacterized protein n=1 Tax=Haloferula luteola TaxID=595692 RepID=A0A840UYV4_9BACT|nr:hypothetical protein [Haloferula luteola]MBB5350962.1 hypothetical protein [Haloferula luteola]